MKKLLAVGLMAGAIAVPTAMAAKPAHTPVKPTKPITKPVKPVVSFLFIGVVNADAGAGATSVEVKNVKPVNRHAKRALGTATTMTVTIQPTTRLRLRVLNPDGTKSFLPETTADLKAGDKIFFHIRARKGSSLTDLVKTKWIRDFTAEPAPVPPAV